MGRTIHQTEVLDDRLRLNGSHLDGALISSVERRGKNIVIGLGERGDLVLHLRMSGRLRTTRSKREIPYTRLILHLDSGDSIYFVNPRRLGTAKHYVKGFAANLGVEPLSPAFTIKSLADLTGKSHSPVKTFLLDQRKISGIGNIYASEALWRSGIAPTRMAQSLSTEEVSRLHKSLVSVLNDAIDGQGTTIGHSVSDYHPAAGEQGEFQNHLSVYGREFEPCERCGTIVVRMKQAGRSTYYCSECQS